MNHVLVTSSRHYQQIYHQPSDDDPDQPKCKQSGEGSVGFVRKDPDTIPYHSECKKCAEGVIQGEQPSTQVCTKLREMDADDLLGGSE